MRDRGKPLARGEVFGCWTIVRESVPDRRGARYLCRAICCGGERVMALRNLKKAATAATGKCVHCKGGGGRKALAHG